MKRLNQTESPIFVILCVLCFQRHSFLTFMHNRAPVKYSDVFLFSYFTKIKITWFLMYSQCLVDLMRFQTYLCKNGKKSF